MERQVEWTEVNLDVGWGVLRGKKCFTGCDGNRPLLRIFGIHGWMDNANTYDLLVPGLPSGTEFCVLDLPGHGFSDHLPNGANYDILTYVINVKAAVTKLGWKSFILIIHSLGGIIGYFYTALFPKEVSGVICFDSLTFQPAPGLFSILRSEVNNTLKWEKDTTDSLAIFSEEEAIQRIIRSRMGGPNNDIVNVDEDAARVLLTRLVKRVSGGLTWRHDRKAVVRFKMIFQGSTWFYLIKQIKCPVLYFHPVDTIYDLSPSERNSVFDIFTSEIEFSKCVVVEGAHHVHLTHPHRLLPDITEFLLKLKETTQLSHSKL